MNRYFRKIGMFILFLLMGIASLICGSSFLSVFWTYYKGIRSIKYSISTFTEILIYTTSAVVALMFQPILLLLSIVSLAITLGLSIICCPVVIYIYRGGLGFHG